MLAMAGAATPGPVRPAFDWLAPTCGAAPLFECCWNLWYVATCHMVCGFEILCRYLPSGGLNPTSLLALFVQHSVVLFVVPHKAQPCVHLVQPCAGQFLQLSGVATHLVQGSVAHPWAYRSTTTPQGQPSNCHAPVHDCVGLTCLYLVLLHGLGHCSCEGTFQVFSPRFSVSVWLGFVGRLGCSRFVWFLSQPGLARVLLHEPLASRFSQPGFAGSLNAQPLHWLLWGRQLACTCSGAHQHMLDKARATRIRLVQALVKLHQR